MYKILLLISCLLNVYSIYRIRYWKWLLAWSKHGHFETTKCWDAERERVKELKNSLRDCQAAVEETAVEEAAIRNLANFGVSEHVYCGICGRKMTREDFLRHVTIYANGECSDLEDFHSTKTFTPEEEKEIEKFLDENRDLMDDLVKSGD